jgi:hypothetical protein
VLVGCDEMERSGLALLTDVVEIFEGPLFGLGHEEEDHAEGDYVESTVGGFGVSKGFS